MSLDMYSAKLIAIDGSKFKAVNALGKDFNQQTIAKRIKLIEESAKRYLKELEAADQEEDKNQNRSFLEEKVKAVLAKKEKWEELLREMKISGQKEVALTDPECRLMKNHGRIEPCYNVHAAVDEKNHLIVDYAVTNSASDNNELSSLAMCAKEMLGAERLDVVADAGFNDSLEIKACVDNGITPYVAYRKQNAGAGGGGVPTAEFTADRFVYDGVADVYVCPAGKRLEFLSLTTMGGVKKMRVYKSKTGACFLCGFFMTKCSRCKGGRMIFRWVYEVVMDEMQQRLKMNPKIMEERKKLAEHPFGSMKRAFNLGYLLLKGLGKVGGEVGFMMLAYNMRRVFNIFGPRMLMLELV
jgi:transposase